MFFFLPIGHDKGVVRRFPIITISIIVVCCLIHAIFFFQMESEERQKQDLEGLVSQLKVEMYFKYSVGNLSPMEMLHRVGGNSPIDLLAGMSSQIDLFWEEFLAGRIVSKDSPEYKRYLDLVWEQEELEKNSILGRFAFRADQPLSYTSITHQFLHGGLLHLLFNMYFLYLVGGAMEDRWGRVVFPIFYLLGGVAACLMHGAIFPYDDRPLIGASGAIMAVMGAFGVRYWKARFRFFYFFWIVIRLHHGVVLLPAYLVVLWYFGGDLVYGLLLKGNTQVAHFAHVGGVLFGAATAVLLSLIKLEDKLVNPVIESKLDPVVYQQDARLLQANRYLGQNKPADALLLLHQMFAENPDDLTIRREMIRAWIMLGRKDDLLEYGREYIDRILALGELNEAADVFREILETVPHFSASAKSQYMLGKYFEEKENWHLAITAYRNLEGRWSRDGLAPKALYKAAGIHERQDEQSEAFKLYKRFLEKYADSPLAFSVKEALAKLTDGQVVFK